LLRSEQVSSSSWLLLPWAKVSPSPQLRLQLPLPLQLEQVSRSLQLPLPSLPEWTRPKRRLA
jgi:hypothetical protein